MQKHVNLVDLVKSFPTNIFLHKLASIQKRMSPAKFAHLAEESENGSISNLSTKLAARRGAAAEQLACGTARKQAVEEQAARAQLRPALERPHGHHGLSQNVQAKL